MKVYALTTAQLAAEQVSETELTARAICTAARQGEVHPIRYALANVFRKNWMSSLTVDAIAAYAAAEFSGRPLPEEQMTALRKDLTDMARAGFLRSRVSGGKRLYELAY